jgi:hypothetical protein
MSQVVRSSSRTVPHEPTVVVRDTSISPRRVEDLVLTWSISRAGAAACGMVKDPIGPPVKLEIRLSSPRRSASISPAARVVDGASEVALPTPIAAASWIEDSISGVWHLDVEGLLKLTIRQGPEGTEALYARTPLLAAAGLGGGRYEFEGAAIRAR